MDRAPDLITSSETTCTASRTHIRGLDCTQADRGVLA
jgi:hypothetical protein